MVRVIPTCIIVDEKRQDGNAVHRMKISRVVPCKRRARYVCVGSRAFNMNYTAESNMTTTGFGRKKKLGDI